MTKVAIITGSSRGIGAACAFKFAAKGYSLTIQGRDADKLAEVEKKCVELGGQVLALNFDLSKTERLHEIVDQTIAKFGRLDILVNNAGMMKPGGLEDQTSDDFDFVMAVNCKAPVFLLQAALPHLKASKG